MAAGAALLLWEMRGQSLALDEWSFLADYRGRSASTLLAPFADNLLVLPIVLSKILYGLFGPDSVAPRLLALALNLTCAGLLYALLRRRVNPWVAVGVAALLIVFGSASDVVAASLGTAILLSVACGLGALLALERGDRHGDLAAMALLLAALASNSHGIPFLVGAAVSIVLVDPRPWRNRAWIVAVPLAAYGAWRLWSLGVDPAGPSGTHPRGDLAGELGSLPSSVFDSLGAAATSVTGLYRAPSEPGPFNDLFSPVLALAILAAVWIRLSHRPLPRREALVFAAMGLSYWALIAVVGNDRLPTVPRYQYLGSIVLILFAAEMVAGLVLPRRAGVAAIGALALALGTNFAALHHDARFFRERGEFNRAALAAIEIARDRVDPSLMVEPIGARLDPAAPAGYSGAIGDLQTDAYISAGRYLSATHSFGSAAFTESELAAATPGARDYADRELAAALGLVPAPVPVAAAPSLRRPRPGCTPGDVRRGLPGRIDTRIEPGASLLVVAGDPGPAQVALRRFGPSYAAGLPAVAAGSAARIGFPADRSRRSWQASVSGAELACVVGP